MVNRLKPLNVVDFTGGVNLRPEAFQLADNELPEMLNMEVDPRGGINTRKAWEVVGTRVHANATWDPRNAYLHIKSNGDVLTLVASKFADGSGHIHGQVNNGTFADLGGGATAVPHLADFASWDDLVYMVNRGGSTSYWNGVGAVTALTPSASANWQNDYTAPGATDTFPQADLIAQHAGYMFVAATVEDGGSYPNRVRWSHPNNPRRWASPDYIDISEGGQHITGLIPFSDRLLVFKPDSVWALFGYDADTWELTNISRTVGALNTQCVCRSETAVFFMSWPHGVFAYTEKGNVEELSVQIRTLFQDRWLGSAATGNVWLGWVGRRLWASVPYDGARPGPDDADTAFVWDPVLTSWTMFRGGLPESVPGPYIERIEANEDEPQLTFMRTHPYVTRLDASPGTAFDLLEPGVTTAFPTRMRTRWLDAGAPTWKKSWRRPDFLLRALTVQASVQCRVYHDFDNSNAQRTFFVYYTPDAPMALWGDFVYGDGTSYGGSDQTSSVERGGTMGRAGTVQVTLDGQAGTQWGLNGIVFKFIPRRFR